MRRLRLLCLLAALLAISGCGGGSSDGQTGEGPVDVVTAAVRDVIAGRYGGFYDRTHPALHAQTSRAAYVDCVAKRGSAANLKFSIVDEADAEYVASDGRKLQGHTVTVRYTLGRETADAVYWLVRENDRWWIVDSVSEGRGDEEKCLQRL
jgi:hypothetical protein